MSAVDWPDFTPYNLHLILRQTMLGRSFFQLVGSSGHPDRREAFTALGFQQAPGSGEWVRMSLSGLTPELIAQYFPETEIKSTPRWVAAPEIYPRSEQEEATVGAAPSAEAPPTAAEVSAPTTEAPAATDPEPVPAPATPPEVPEVPAAAPAPEPEAPSTPPATATEVPANEGPEHTETATTAFDEETNEHDRPIHDSGIVGGERSGLGEHTSTGESSDSSTADGGAIPTEPAARGGSAVEETTSDPTRDALPGSAEGGEHDSENGARISNGDVPDGRLNYQYPADSVGVPADADIATKRNASRQGLSTLIELELEAGERDAEIPEDKLTPERLESLAQFSGWSTTMRPSNDSPSHAVIELPHGGDWLDSHFDYMSKSRMNSAMLTSFYTPAPVVRALWAAVRKMGFDGGRIIDPACGSGFFIGHSGDDGRRFQFHGVDMDSVGTRMARLLYPKAHIHNKRLQDFKAPDESFDLAITNVPFDQVTVYDPQYSKNFSRLMVHDYYFLRAMDMVRPGGIVAFITAYGTMDKPDQSIRRALADQADLLTALRLPAGIFDGTSAGADIIILQKRTPDMTAAPNPLWVESTDVQLPQASGNTVVEPAERHNLSVNAYFSANPDRVIGTMAAVFGQHGHRVASVMPQDERAAAVQSLSEVLADAVPSNVYAEAPPSLVAGLDHSEMRPPTFAIHNDRAGKLPVGCFVLNDDNELCVLDVPDDTSGVSTSNTSSATLANLSAQMTARLTLVVPLRDAALELLDAQQAGCDDDRLAELQANLASAYEAFTRKYGPLGQRRNMSAILAEPYSGLIFSLEIYDDETETATRAPIFSERTVGPAEPIDHAENVDDALMISLNDYGRPEPTHMARLLGDGTTAADVIERLGDKIFLDPETGRYQNRTKYLSGNIAQRLSGARIASEVDPQFERNVAALEQVMPAPLTPSQISFGMGLTWIPTQFYEQFLAQQLGCSFDESDPEATTPVTVTYNEASGGFSFMEQRDFYSACDHGKVNNWSTDRCGHRKIIDAALNNRTIELTVPAGDGGHRVPDRDGTAEANKIVTKLRDAFSVWATAEPNRSDRLVEIYNNTINVWVEPEYDGSHLTFPGLAIGESFRPHQVNFAWRVLQDGNALAAHVVGAGKSGAMIAASMESKRLGYSRKPMFVVPKQVLMQFASEINRFYPTANVLVVTNNDLSKDARKRFLARVSTHNWDAVVITHDAFSRIPMSPDTQIKYLTQRINEVENAIGDGTDRATERVLRRRLVSLENRLTKLMSRDKEADSGAVFFEQLGVDMISVDEAHRFKNLAVSTNMADTPGINTTDSKRATDMHMKCDYITELNGEERGVVFATGTPISNSMVEMYTMSRYLSPSSLSSMGMGNFDAWANQFGRVQVQLERAPDGSGYRMHGRFSKFVNVPELVKIFRQVADVKMHRDLDLQIPEREVHEHSIEPTPMLTAFMRSLAYRASHRGMIAGRRNDNILAISVDGRHASLDMRTLSRDMPDVGGKLDAVVEQIVASYHAEADRKGVNLVFCDLSTPKKDRWSFYDSCRSALIEKGIPEDEIAFIHDSNTDTAKARTFEAVCQGRIRVFLGSTEKMGTGTNIQNRICDMHHVDPPWRPSDFEQRQGRGIRQGNMFEKVREHFYVTRDSYDEFMLGAVKRKADFIAQALTNPDLAQRTIEEQADPTYAEIMALSTGNPLIKEMVTLEAQVEELSTDERIHQDRAHRTRFSIRNREQLIEQLDPSIERLTVDIEERDEEPEHFLFATPEPYDESGSCEITNRRLFGEYVLQIASNLSFRNRETATLGTYAGITYRLSSLVSLDGGLQLDLQRKGHQPTHVPLTDNPNGVASQVTHLYRDMSPAVDKMKTRRDEAALEIEQLKQEAPLEFEHQEELDAARERLADVNAELAEAANSEDDSVSYPPELMRALVRMMRMRDRNDSPLVPPEMITHDERQQYETELALFAQSDLGEGIVLDAPTNDEAEGDDISLVNTAPVNTGTLNPGL